MEPLQTLVNASAQHSLPPNHVKYFSALVLERYFDHSRYPLVEIHRRQSSVAENKSGHGARNTVEYTLRKSTRLTEHCRQLETAGIENSRDLMDRGDGDAEGQRFLNSDRFPYHPVAHSPACPIRVTIVVPKTDVSLRHVTSSLRIHLSESPALDY